MFPGQNLPNWSPYAEDQDQRDPKDFTQMQIHHVAWFFFYLFFFFAI